MKLKFKPNPLQVPVLFVTVTLDTEVEAGGRSDTIFDTKNAMPLNSGFSYWCGILNVHSSFYVQAFV